MTYDTKRFSSSFFLYWRMIGRALGLVLAADLPLSASAGVLGASSPLCRPLGWKKKTVPFPRLNLWPPLPPSSMGIPLVYVLKGTHPLAFICTLSYLFFFFFKNNNNKKKWSQWERGACQRPSACDASSSLFSIPPHPYQPYLPVDSII